MLELVQGSSAMMENAAEETAPHKVCAYVYELANAFQPIFIMKPRSSQGRMKGREKVRG